MKKIKMKMNNLEDNGEYIGAPGAITGTDLSKYYDQYGKFDSQAAIQSGEKVMDVLEALFHQPYNHLESNYGRFILHRGGCSVYSKPDSVNKDFTGGHPRRTLGPGLYEYLDMDLDYSKLSTVNTNNGQDSTFSFNSCNNKPTKVVERRVTSKTYRPLPDCLTIKEGSIDGVGVFATSDIYLLSVRDPNVWKTHTLLVYNDGCDNKVEELLRSGLGAYINHSNNPNCTLGKMSSITTDEIIVEKYFLKPLREISKGEEILLNYSVELCGLSGYEGAEFLKEEEDKLEDRVYRSAYGDVYEYNPSFGKFQLVGVSKNNGRIFYTAADVEIFLNRIR